MEIKQKCLVLCLLFINLLGCQQHDIDAHIVDPKQKYPPSNAASLIKIKDSKTCTDVVRSYGNLSSLIDFNTCHYVGYDGNLIYYREYQSSDIYSIDLKTYIRSYIMTLDTHGKTFATFDYSNGWIVWSESDDTELRVGESTGRNWMICAANVVTRETLILDKEEDSFPTDRDFNAQPLYISTDGNVVAYRAYTYENGIVKQGIKLAYINSQDKPIFIDSDSIDKFEFMDPSVCSNQVTYLKRNIQEKEVQSLLYLCDKREVIDLNPPQQFVEIQTTDGRIVARTSSQITENDGIYFYDIVQKKWNKKYSFLSEYSQTIRNTEISSIQCDGDYIVWRPDPNDSLKIINSNNDKCYDLSPFSDNIAYVVYPFENNFLVWCENDSNSMTGVYKFILLK